MIRCGSFVVLVSLFAAFGSAQNAREPGPGLLNPSFGNLPLYFVENQGVYPDEVEFYV